MKVFWALLGLIFVAAAALVLSRSGGGAAPSNEVPASASSGGAAPPAPAKVIPQPTPPAEPASPAPSQVTAAAPTAAPSPVTPPLVEKPAEPAPPAPAVVAKPAPAPPPAADVPPPPKIEDLLPTPGLDPDAPSLPRPVPENPQPPAMSPADGPAAPSPASPTGPALVGEPIAFTEAWPEAKVVPSRVQRRDDGSMLIDGRFLVRGKGTAADPYQLPWPLITSADETYNPRLGKTRIPQRVTMFDGAYVEIDGYTAFPLGATAATEMLVMLNQWDGCCIGVPPTAYDAVEVKLAQPPSREQRLATHGTLRGKLKVDPYEDGGWLLGLYVLQDATLKADN